MLIDHAKDPLCPNLLWDGCNRIQTLGSHIVDYRKCILTIGTESMETVTHAFSSKSGLFVNFHGTNLFCNHTAT